MIRKDVPYKGKRSNELLKIKAHLDDEYRVTGVEMGPIRYIKHGTEVEEEMLSAVKIQHKGFEVSVGSGFKIAERQYYYKFPDEINGQVITVRYTEETHNEHDEISLRFPRFVGLWGKERDI